MTPALSVSDRRPVWIALSELWLDTELSAADLDRIAGVLRASPYSLEEIDAIHWEEVAPVVWVNALSVAGVWDAFDADWLAERCARAADRRGRWKERLVSRALRAWGHAEYDAVRERLR